LIELGGGERLLQKRFEEGGNAGGVHGSAVAGCQFLALGSQ
jgi:hypothetical protein